MIFKYRVFEIKSLLTHIPEVEVELVKEIEEHENAIHLKIFKTDGFKVFF